VDGRLFVRGTGGASGTLCNRPWGAEWAGGARRYFISPLRGFNCIRQLFRGLTPTAKIFRRCAAGWPSLPTCMRPIAGAIRCGSGIQLLVWLCTKSHFVGGVSDADLAQLHTLVSVAARYRGQRPLPQTFCATPISFVKARNLESP
jgi:hypothetical protein